MLRFERGKPLVGPVCRAARAAAIGAALTFFSVACSSAHSSGPDAGEALRVTECEDYASKAASCFHRTDVQRAIAVTARNETERARMSEQCTQSLQRLSDACH